MPKIVLETLINAPREVVFDLSRSVELHKISTRQTYERAIAGRTSGLMEYRDRVTWKARHFGVYQQLTSKITEYERPRFFVDEMEEGIFKSLRHEHYFSQTEEGTLMKDIFHYESPLGILGQWADGLFLQSYMHRLIDIRNETIKEFAESGKWRELIPENIDLTENIH